MKSTGEDEETLVVSFGSLAPFLSGFMSPLLKLSSGKIKTYWLSSMAAWHHSSGWQPGTISIQFHVSIDKVVIIWYNEDWCPSMAAWHHFCLV